MLLIVIVTIQTFWPILPLKNKFDITNRYYTYNMIQDELAEYLNRNPELKQKRILSNNFQIPSMINFYLKPNLEAICLLIGYHESLYTFLYSDDELNGDDFLYLFKGTVFPDGLKPYFDDFKMIQQFASTRGYEIISEYSLWEANNYHGQNP